MENQGNIYLLLGANLGDRLETFQQARQMINLRAGKIISQSGIYETAPWGVTDQPAFLNQVIEIVSTFAPEALLQAILQIEQDLGRIRRERWGARVIDIDLLYYSGQIIETSYLTVPHPRISERRFTLIPLAEIAPDWIDPRLQLSISTLLETCTDDSSVSKFY